MCQYELAGDSIIVVSQEPVRLAAVTANVTSAV